MRIDSALLCDAATVREGLLHILGGGITRVNRPSFPAPLGVTLAMRILVQPDEADRTHVLSVRLRDAEGQFVASMEAEFGVNAAEALQPDEESPLPVVVALPAQLPRPGAYSFDLFVDETPQASLAFVASATPEILGSAPSDEPR